MKKLTMALIMVTIMGTTQPTYAAIGEHQTWWGHITQPFVLVANVFSSLFNNDKAKSSNSTVVSTAAREGTVRSLALGPESPAAVFAPDGPGVITGKLYSGYIDYIDGQAESFYFVHDPETNIMVSLQPKKKLPSAFTAGATVTARGQVVNGTMEVVEYGTVDSSTTGGTVQIVQQASVQSSTVPETRTVAVILLDFDDLPEVCPKNEVNDLMFGGSYSVAQAFTSASHGQLTFTGDVLGPFTAGVKMSDLKESLHQLADRILSQQGINIFSYDHQMIVTGDPGGSIGGYAYFDDGRSVIYRCNVGDVYEHELGHNVGLDHARTENSEYADKSSFMGGSGGWLRHGNAVNLQYMNWLPAMSYIDVAGGSSGTFTLSPIDKRPGDVQYPQVLRIASSTLVSYRSDDGYGVYTGPTYQNKISVHSVDGRGSMYRAVVDDKLPYLASNGLSIQQVSEVEGENVTFSLETDCVSQPPSLTISPSEQGVQPGGSAIYNFSFFNNDIYCGGQEISLTYSADNPNLSLPNPYTFRELPGTGGRYGSFTVTGSSAITSGAHPFTVTATVGGVSTSVDALYSIDTESPTAATNLSGSYVNKSKEIILVWNAASDNIDMYPYYDVYRNGTLLRAGVGQTSFTDRFPSSGENKYHIITRDHGDNQSGPSNTITISTKGGGGGGKTGGGGGGKCSPWPSCR